VATTTVALIGNTKAPVIVLDNVLPMAAYVSLRDDLRGRTDFIEGHGNDVSFPGKIAKVDRAIVDPLLDNLQHNKEVGKIYPSAMFNEQRAHVRGFASLLCNEGRVRNDYMDTKYEGVVAPAAVFYFAFDGVDDASTTTTTQTGMAFYREKISGLERVTSVVGNETVFCGLYPDSVGCPGGGGEAAAGGGGAAAEQDGNLRFEQIHHVEGVPNRMVFYPQDVLHNAWVGGQENGTVPVLPCSVKNGRLAISLFFLSQGGGLEVVDVLKYDWKKEATVQLKGGGGVNEIDSTVPARQLQAESAAEAHRRLVAWRRLTVCSFTPGASFNVVTGDCSLSVTTTISSGEELRIKGSADVSHPALDRGGVANANGQTSVYAHHFVLDGTGKLTLVNLKLKGAWVGNTNTGCNTNCGYCQRTVSVLVPVPCSQTYILFEHVIFVVSA
jgi:hypothetical protein